MKRSHNPKKFLSDEELSRIKAKIAGAEKLTSAEIKLVIAKQCWTDIRRKALHILKKYNLSETHGRNCVLILLVMTNREFLIYGDQGIHEKVGQNFWDEVRETMVSAFNKNEIGEGLCLGIHLIGEKLAPFFPHKEDDENEISNDIIFEN